MFVDYLTHAKEAIKTEQKALELLIAQLDQRFVTACQLIENCQGRVVVTGMGKSGLIGRKIAATFASTGTPAFFMHPGEAGHGDLGMLVKGDVLLGISNSGESDEIRMLLPVVKQLGIPLISISRDGRGMLPKSADVALTLGASEEACPLGLAPTSSTTATLALGDALAVTLRSAHGLAALLGVGCILAPLLKSRYEQRFAERIWFAPLAALWPVAGFLLSFALIASREAVPFLYFQF